MILEQLVAMTAEIGEPHRNYVIIGEGNTSATIDDATFYVKASGHQMGSITADGMVAVRFDPILDLLENPPQTRTDLKERMMAARIDQSNDTAPSIETSFHAMLLKETGAKFIGHTHPIAVNQLTCSVHAQMFAEKRLFPDHAVVCGPAAAFVPYADPGIPLALAIRDSVRAYTRKFDRPPHEIVLANHGLIALGQTPQEVLNITAMSTKAAEILVGALSVGGAVYLDEAEMRYMYDRPDEIYRRNQFL